MVQALISRWPPGRRPARGPRLARAAIALGLVALMSVPVHAEDVPLSPDLQLPIILKVLVYDRHFESRFGAEFTLGILYEPRDADSLKAAEGVSDYMFRMRGKTEKTLPIRYLLVDYTGPESLERSITTHAIDVLYVAPGNTNNLAGITKISQKKGVTTTTGVPDYVRSGVAVGVGKTQDHAQILINLPCARAEGSEFDASLLRIATVIRTCP
jgi:YfiR/HmsC-like